MSLQDESFPTDELFDQLNNLSSSGARNTWFAEHHKPAVFERDTAPFLEICYADPDFDADGDVANKSAKTCVSDPVGRDQEDEDDYDEDVDGDDHKLGCEKAPLGSGRSSKAVSYQDIHSAYTKRRFQHVTSKVGQYIAEIQAQDQKRRNVKFAGFQRVNSMPESLTPTLQQVYVHDGDFKVDKNCQTHSNSDSNYNSNSNNSSSSFDRLLAENESLQQKINSLRVEAKRLQGFNEYVQERLDRKTDDFVKMKCNFETLRTELSECQQKLRRQQDNSQHHFMYHIRSATSAKATQTDFLVDTIPASGNVLVTPHPLGDLTYNSSKGSIELALLSVAPSARVAQNPVQVQRAIHPQSLDFSSVSTEADGSGSGEHRVETSSRALVRRTPAPNNSETSQPSSNDSAIEVEAHEEERPSSRRQWEQQGELISPRQWGQHEGMYYFDKRNNRVIEVMGFNISQGRNQSHDTIHNQSINDSQTRLLVHSMSMSHLEAHDHFRSKRTTLGSRMLRFLGPCVRCRNGDPLNRSNVTYKDGLPAMPEEEFVDQRNQR
uniref:Protein swallow n=1 Tax=Drosophila melanogaster TaxID=7227 RepID=SWA_DROME|eukprot:NP_511060.2 swallow [Drosophila melanogaster]